MIVFIHAGMHKTGSTHIQNSLFKNRHALRRSGVAIWPHSVNDDFPVRCVAADPALRQSEAKIKRTAAALIRDIRQARDAGMRKYLLVGEAIGIRLDEAAVRRLRERLVPVTDDIRILFYLREPVSFAAASIQEIVKYGVPLSTARARKGDPRYRARIEPFLRGFPPQSVSVRPYHRSVLRDGDILSDYLEAIGETAVAPLLGPSGASNVSLCHEAVEILDHIIAIHPRAKKPPLRPAIIAMLERVDGRPFRVNASEAGRILSGAAEDIDWLTAELGRDILRGLPQASTADAWPAAPEVRLLVARSILLAAQAEIQRQRAPLARLWQAWRRISG